MRRLRDALSLMLAATCGMAGCASADIAPRPPKHPDEITVPPVDDSKFSSPPKYPEGTLNHNDPSRPPGGTPMPGGPGGPPGAGGMGGMSGMGGMNGMGGMGSPYGPGGGGRFR